MTLLVPTLRAWRERRREPGLSVLLALELLSLFVVMPLDEMGILTSWFTDAAVVLVLVAATVVVSRHRAAVAAILVSAAVAGWTSWMRGTSPLLLNDSLQ